jgi:O-antigen ligase
MFSALSSNRVFGLIAALPALLPAVLAPLPFGSQGAVWQVVWLAPLSISLILVSPSRHPVLVRWLIFSVLVIIVATFAIILYQRSAPTEFHFPIWDEAARQLGETRAGYAAASAHIPALDLLPGVLPLLAFLGAMTIGLHRGLRSRDILAFTSIVCGVYALLWLILYIQDPQSVLWRVKTHHVNFLTGTFMNRNMAAAFLGLGTVASILLAAEDAFGRRETRSRAWRWLAIAALLILVAGMTKSRTGQALALFAATLGVLIRHGDQFAWRRLRERKQVLVIAALIYAIAGGMIISSVMVRFAQNDTADASRFEVYGATLRMIGDHPWSGIGPGQFVNVFPTYRPASMISAGVWERAHNTYLQVAAELGVPLVLLALIPIALLLLVYWRAARSGGRGALAGAFGLSALSMPLLHSMVDYPAQIPGYSIPAAALFGTLAAFCARLNDE